MTESLAVMLPYQRDWVADRAQVKVYEKSRRIGITWAEAADRALVAASREGMDTWYIGYNKEMALEFVETAADWARKFNKAAEAIEETVIDDEGKDILAYRIRFASGFKITALSSRPSNLRGKQGCAVIDEAAFHGELKELMKAALAFTIWGGQVHIISTHNGIDNPFNELVEDCRTAKLKYSLHRTTFDEALAQGLYQKICAERKLTWSAETEKAWADEIYAFYGDNAEEELRCIPMSKGGAWLPYDLILAAEDSDAGKPELYQGGPIYIGNDIGRRKDLWIAWVLERVFNTLVTREIRELKGQTFATQDAVMDEMDLFYRTRSKGIFKPAWAMDQTGMGEKPVEDAKRRYPGRVDGVIFTQASRLDIANVGKQAFEDRKILIPAKRSEVRADLHKPRAEKTATGGTRIMVERTEEGHADRFWALMLATAKADPYRKLPPAQIWFPDSDDIDDEVA